MTEARNFFDNYLLSMALEINSNLLPSGNVSFDIYRIGKLIGFGFYKECFEDMSNPRQVLIITCNFQQWEIEVETYRELKSIGIRTPKIIEWFSIPRPEGGEVLIIVMEKLRSIRRWELASSEDLLVDVLFSLEYMWENNIYARDLQFLADSSGPVFIDPLFNIYGLGERLHPTASMRNALLGTNEFTIYHGELDNYLNDISRKKELDGKRFVYDDNK